MTTTGIRRKCRVRLDLAERLAAVHLGHVEVEDDQARPRAGLRPAYRPWPRR